MFKVGALWRIVRRHLLLITLVIVVTLGAVIAYSLWVTPIYEVTSLISVDEKRSSLPDVYQRLSLQENAVATEMQMLRSRTLATRVVDDHALQVALTAPRRHSRAEFLRDIAVTSEAMPAAYRLTRGPGKQFILENRTTRTVVGRVTPGATVRVPGVSFVLRPEAAQRSRIDFAIVGRDAAVEALQKMVRVDRPARDANVVSVSIRGTDSVVIRDALNTLASQFIESRQGVQKTETRSAVLFLRQQLDTLSRQLSVAEDSLRVYREQQQVVRLDAEATNEVGRFVSAQADRNVLDAERSALSALVQATDAADKNGGNDALSDSITSHYRRLIAFPSLLKQPVASELLESLSKLEDQRAQLRTRRTVRDPEVQGLTERINGIDAQIRSLAVTYLDGLNHQVAALDQTLGKYGNQLTQFPQKEVAYARLERSTKVLSDAFMLLQTRLKEAEIAQAVEDPSVRVVDAAVLPSRPLRPNVPANLAVGLVLGTILGLGAALLRHLSDQSVRTRDDVRLAAGLPVIGLIPSTGAAKADAIMSDSYARLEANLAHRSLGGPRKLLITSPMAGDGKTTSAVNLALTHAKRGRRVLLIDADLRNSGLRKALTVGPGRSTRSAAARGLSDILSGAVAIHDVVRQVRNNDDGPSFDYIPAGTQHRDPVTLLGSARFQAFIDSAAAKYDILLLDTPPLVVPDAVVLCQFIDGVLVVVRAGETARNTLGYAVQQLRVVEAPVVGAVLNDIDFRRDGTYDEAFGYYGAAYGYVALNSPSVN